MQAKKTHEQQLRILQRRPEVPDRRRLDAELPHAGEQATKPRALRARSRNAEFPVSRGGMNQESRDHHKHNRPGQTGHKPQRHSPAEEKD
jgi:hypothetical protein